MNSRIETSRISEPLEQVADPKDALRVEPVHRLVEHHRRRVAEQGAGDAETLAHAERERAGAFAGHLVQADQVNHLVDATATDPDGRRHRQQVIAGGPAGVHGPCLQQGPHLVQRRPMPGVLLPVDGDRARGRIVQVDDHAHRGGLAGAVRAEEAGYHTRADGETQVLHGGLLAVLLGQAPGLDHHCLVSLPRRSSLRTVGRSRGPAIELHRDNTATPCAPNGPDAYADVMMRQRNSQGVDQSPNPVVSPINARAHLMDHHRLR
jgi:hypothetical protein